MKKLRRRRSSSVDISAPTAVSLPAPPASSLPTDTPLYARFASSRRGRDGSAPAFKSLVSGPMALSPKSSGGPVPRDVELGANARQMRHAPRSTVIEKQADSVASPRRRSLRVPVPPVDFDALISIVRNPVEDDAPRIYHPITATEESKNISFNVKLQEDISSPKRAPLDTFPVSSASLPSSSVLTSPVSSQHAARPPSRASRRVPVPPLVLTGDTSPSAQEQNISSLRQIPNSNIPCSSSPSVAPSPMSLSVVSVPTHSVDTSHSQLEIRDTRPLAVDRLPTQEQGHRPVISELPPHSSSLATSPSRRSHRVPVPISTQIVDLPSVLAAPISPPLSPKASFSSTSIHGSRKRGYSLLAAFGLRVPKPASGCDTNNATVGSRGDHDKSRPSSEDRLPAEQTPIPPSIPSPFAASTDITPPIIQQTESPHHTHDFTLSHQQDMHHATLDSQTLTIDVGANNAFPSPPLSPRTSQNLSRRTLRHPSSVVFSNSTKQYPSSVSLRDAELENTTPPETSLIPSSPTERLTLLPPHASQPNPKTHPALRHTTSRIDTARVPVPIPPIPSRTQQPHPIKLDSPNSYKDGPVSHRPLIFAAMAAAEAEAELVEPQAWMSFDTKEPKGQTDVEYNYAQAEEQDGAAFVRGYPTPRSSSPQSPDVNVEWMKQRDLFTERPNGPNGGYVEIARSPPRRETSLQSSQALPQSPPDTSEDTQSSSDSQPVSRVKRLSKSKARTGRVADSSPPDDVGGQHTNNNGDTLTATTSSSRDRVPKVHSRAAPSQPTVHISNASTSQLGPPFQLQNEDSLRERTSAESMRAPVPLPHRGTASDLPRSVPARPVKVLTERQLEKLKARVPRASSESGMESTEHRNGGVHERNHSMEEPPLSPTRTKAAPPSPVSPEEYAQALAVPAPEAEPETEVGTEAKETNHVEPEEQKEPTFYPLARHLAASALLVNLVSYLSFFDWLAVISVSKEIRTCISGDRESREGVLERYLRTVGYARWAWTEPEPVVLTLSDLNAYMRGVSMPTHQFARMAKSYLQSRDPAQVSVMQRLAHSCRAFTRVVLRLRAQAETEASHNSRIAASASQRDIRTTSQSPYKTHTGAWSGQQSRSSMSRSSSRAPSPTSSFNHSYAHSTATHTQLGVLPVNTFASPLFRLRRAPLLQVFVPSPEGDWLSDASVLECEKELKRAGVLHLMRAGDVVWDAAVGDEGNVGRLVWDGGYLIDLDYTYSRSGDLPMYLPTLAFPPSYFHRVVRTMGSGNPIVHIDIAPWAEEIATKLQLLQDRTKTETPQGGYHTVVRWVHRSSFIIRPPPGSKSIRIPVPSTAGPGPSPTGAWVVDPGWYGVVVVEAEGTNEGLADLQERCKGAFPPRAVGASASPERSARLERKTVFRILRERSRPGEIWIRTHFVPGTGYRQVHKELLFASALSDMTITQDQWPTSSIYASEAIEQGRYYPRHMRCIDAQWHVAEKATYRASTIRSYLAPLWRDNRHSINN
ncbi:hypothetical protein A0H81_02251 [Grifola frondosa]|uniref:Uncharacterized protein n=1 Tax=Grifola frondosa TaxID=5627 RepID=A0A1C7MLD6_GRIFR|nr:hypothetical protein A0H81_02251 [Grifola frondosa]